MNKHIINDPQNVTIESIKGLAYLNPKVAFDETNKVLYLEKLDSAKVALISGGGSGHEPAHAAYVEKGMLSAAVAGAVFASPNSRQVESALKRTRGTKGHFDGCETAKERHQANFPEEKVEMVIVQDDVSVGREAGNFVGRRGLAGTVLVHKITGALAEQGAELDEVANVAQFVIDNSATIGVGLEHSNVPGAKTEEERLKPEEMEVGMGIHNEPGHETTDLPTAAKLVNSLLSTLTSTSDKDRNFVPFKRDGSDQIVLLVNNLGGISELEMGVVVKEAGEWLHNNHFHVKRAIAGTLMTSLNMPGFSLTLVLLNAESKLEHKFDVETLLELLDAPVEAPGWKLTSTEPPNVDIFQKKDNKAKKETNETKSDISGPEPMDSKLFEKAVEAACKAVIEAEAKITEYDTITGDGDAGETLRSGAKSILKKIQEEDRISSKNLAAAFVEISDSTETSMGGTSGALYSIFFNALAGAFGGESGKADLAMWAKALEKAFNHLLKYTRARPPSSRTLIDPLSAFVTTLSLTPDDLDGAMASAKEAAEATAFLEAKVGRSVYMDEKKLKSAQVPDPGAHGLWVILEAIHRELLISKP